MSCKTCACCVVALTAWFVPILKAEMVTRRWGTPPMAPAGAAPPARRAKPPTGYAAKTKTAPVIDGRLNDEVWAGAPILRLARTPDGAGRPAQPTEVRLLRDEETLYVGVRCTEPQTDRVRASRGSHDGPIWSDDSIEIFLGVGGVYYHFGVNAAGRTYDAQAKDKEWNSLFKAAAVKGRGQWTMEVAIPLAKMAGEGKLPTEWIANFNRNRYVTGSLQEATWSPTYSGDSHVPERFGRLLFKAPPPPERPAKPLQPVIKKKFLQVLPCEGGEGVAVFDLSGLPKGTKVHRADLLIFRTSRITGRDEDALIDIEVYPLFSKFAGAGQPKVRGEPLKLRGPWYDRLDATEAVRQWAGGADNGGFFVKSCRRWNAEATCLDIAYEGQPEKVPPQASGLKAFHRSGQTFLTWKEIEDPVGSDQVKWGQLKLILGDLDRERRLRYCVYRSEEPITAGTIHRAELIATVKPLSSWNVNGRNIGRPIDHVIATQDVLMTGHWNPFGSASVDGDYGRDCPVDRLVIREGQAPLARQTGLYVHSTDKKGKAYYAVLTSIEGVQNTTDFSAANSLTNPIDEAPGEGQPVLQGKLPHSPIFSYADERLHYVRWVGRPYGNLPYQYYNWSVAVPEEHAENPPLELNLHRDGYSYWRTHYRIERDSIVLCPYDFPIKSWWYGYHESQGTLKSFRQGRIHNYTERRLLWFVDWAARKWKADRKRILVTGCRGGASGSGALRLGIRHPDLFNLVIAGHPTVDYAPVSERTDRRAVSAARSMQAIWGKAEWKLQTSDGKSFWDQHNMIRVVQELPATAGLPLITMTSDYRDADSRKFYEVMLQKRFGLLAEFWWGGGRYIPVSRTGTYPNVIRLDVAKDQPMLACASAGAMGLVTKPQMGSFNRNFRWRDVVDEPGRYEVTIFLQGRGDNTTDVALRRLRRFKPAKGKTYVWKNTGGEGKAAISQSGEATVGADGLLVISGVKFSGQSSRLVVTPKE